jgi:ribosomal protein S8
MLKNYFYTTSLLSKIKLAYKRRCLYIVDVQMITPHLHIFLCKLQAWGLISYFEVKRLSVLNRSRKNPSLYVQCTIFLKYTEQKPAISFWTFNSYAQAKHSFSYTFLHKLSWYQPGINFILRTKYGLIPLADCLKMNCGGSIFLAIKT